MPIPIPTVYKITFRNQPGIVIMMKSSQLGTLMKISAMGITTDEKKNMKAFGYIAKRIIEWNVDHPEIEPEFEDDEITDICRSCGLQGGDRLPVTAKGLSCLPIDFVQSMVGRWMMAITSVNPGKDESLSYGESDTDMPTSELGSMQNQISSELLNKL